MNHVPYRHYTLVPFFQHTRQAFEKHRTMRTRTSFLGTNRADCHASPLRLCGGREDRSGEELQERGLQTQKLLLEDDPHGVLDLLVPW